MYYKSFQTKNKFKAVKTFFNGKKYDSKKEATWAMYYENLLKTKKIKDLETHKKIDLYGENKNRICGYYADFVITHLDETMEIIDVKSKITVTPVFKLKWKLLQDKYKYEIKRGEVKLTIQL